MRGYLGKPRQQARAHAFTYFRVRVGKGSKSVDHNIHAAIFRDNTVYCCWTNDFWQLDL